MLFKLKGQPKGKSGKPFYECHVKNPLLVAKGDSVLFSLNWHNRTIKKTLNVKKASKINHVMFFHGQNFLGMKDTFILAAGDKNEPSD